MQSRTLVALAVVFVSLASVQARAQVSSTTAGLVPGSYVRLSVGQMTPVNAQGSLKDWNGGPSVNVMWENWDNSSRGLSLLGFGAYGELSYLGFNGDQFKEDFSQGPFGRVRTAEAGRARVIQFGVTTRLRIPMPIVMPSIGVGFGFLDWSPAQIRYTTVEGINGTAKQQNRRGAAFSLMGGLDAVIYGRVAAFGEAAYSYGFTSFGQGLAGSGTQCLQSNCDLLKNTSLGVIRGGLRVRTNR